MLNQSTIALLIRDARKDGNHALERALLNAIPSVETATIAETDAFIAQMERTFA